MQKNPQTKEDTFWIFTDFHYGVANPKIVMLLLFQILCIDCFFFFFLNPGLLWTKIHKIFHGPYMGRKQSFEFFFEKWVLWVVRFLEVDAFLPIWTRFL